MLKDGPEALRCSSGSVGSRSVAAADEDDLEFAMDGDDMLGDHDGAAVEQMEPGPDQGARMRRESIEADRPTFGVLQSHVQGQYDPWVPTRGAKGQSVSVRSVPLRGELPAMGDRIRHLEAVNAALVSRLEAFRAQNLANVQAALQEREALLVSAWMSFSSVPPFG